MACTSKWHAGIPLVYLAITRSQPVEVKEGERGRNLITLWLPEDCSQPVCWDVETSGNVTSLQVGSKIF